MTQPIPPTDATTPPEPVVDETLMPLEAAFYALVLAALTVWLAAVARKVLAPWRLYRMAPQPSALWETVPMWTAEVTKLVTWLNRNAVKHGWDRYDHETDLKVPAFLSNDSYALAHLAQVANYLVRIPDEVYQRIFAEITDGYAAGESVEQIADRIDNVLRVTGSENWPGRARTISITEVNGAANAGWLGAALQTEQILGTPLYKEWLSAHDNNVRTAHKKANGQRRRLLEPFIVMGEPLMQPGAKNGSPENIINCRCAPTTTEKKP